MFRGLKARRIVANLSTGEGFRGTVVTAGWFTLRLASVEILTPTGPQQLPGILRVARRAVLTIQEL